MKKQLKLKSGITLIALVITIIILIILAGVSISILSGENGLINKAIQAKERQEYSNYSDRLQLVVHNTYLNTQSKEIDTYIADIKKDEMLKDARIDKEDDITAYITLDNKYVFTLQVARSGQINLEYNGIAGKLLPKVIRLSIINVKSNSITVNTEALRTDSYKYYIKNPTTGEYDYKGENKTGTFEYTELAQGITLELKVVAINENGEDYKTITEITRTMPTGTITIGNAQWHNNTHKASVTVSSTDTNYQLQYSTDQETWLPINSGEETEEQPNNTTVYARLFDGTNAPDEEYVHYTIEDNIAPTAPTLTISGTPATDVTNWYTANVTVKVTDGTDADSGVARTTYTLTGATAQAETEIANNGTITISNNGTTTITAYTYDGANNKSVAATKIINKDAGTPSYSAVSGQSYELKTHTHVSGCYTSVSNTCGKSAAFKRMDKQYDASYPERYNYGGQFRCADGHVTIYWGYRSPESIPSSITCPTVVSTSNKLTCTKTVATYTATLNAATNMQRRRLKLTTNGGTINTITWSSNCTKVSNYEVILPQSGTYTCTIKYTVGESSGTKTLTYTF